MPEEIGDCSLQNFLGSRQAGTKSGETVLSSLGIRSRAKGKLEVGLKGPSLTPRWEQAQDAGIWMASI